jgi:hypothetical protein
LLTSERLALLAVCVVSVGFLLWVVIAAQLDEKRRRRKTFNTSAVPIEVVGERGYGFRTALASKGQRKQLHVLRLKDADAEGSSRKLRWLIMGLLLIVIRL